MGEDVREVFDKKCALCVWTVILIFVSFSTAYSQRAAPKRQSISRQIQDLEIASGVYSDGVEDDWLVKPVNAKAGVFRNSKGNELILSNGLISRTFRLEPNAATVSLKELTNQAELVRAVRPEAIVELEGVSFEIGGLKGQRDLAFIYDDWIEEMEGNPLAFSLKSISVGSPDERFGWGRVRHHLPDYDWPPKGVKLEMSYRLGEIGPEEILALSRESDAARELFLLDEFTELSDEWNLHHNNAHPRSSFDNEGKAGEIYTPNNTSVYVERILPHGTGLVETAFDVGTDLSGAWGPGIALVWPNRIVKVNVKPGNDGGGENKSPWKFAVFDGKRENSQAGGKFSHEFEGKWHLRIRLKDEVAYCEMKPEGGNWKTLEAVPLNPGEGYPKSVRIGKLGLRANGEDHGENGNLVRLKYERFAAYGDLEERGIQELKDKFSRFKDVRVSVNYELYDGVPAYSKWVEVENETGEPLRIGNIISEQLAAADHYPVPTVRGKKEYTVTPNIHVETEMAFGAMRVKVANRGAVRWEPDNDYVTQISYKLEVPTLLNVSPVYGYHTAVDSGETFSSIRAFVLPQDSFDFERKGLALRKMYRTLAPWTTENPMMFHLVRSGWEAFKAAIDQCVEVGYEAMNLSFGSGFNAENDSPENITKMKKFADYAASKGIEIGTYTLLASRRISEKDDVINPATGKRGGFAIFGNSPCLGSEWGLEYFEKLYRIYGETGFKILTHDGNYPGDVCASESHPGHEGLADSQYRQWRIISDFYKWAKSQGVYLKVPDYYYMAGSNQCGVGYREHNWSLPRRQQLVHTRQNIFDGTWDSTSSMRWSFIPLSQYHGGGAAATIEPLKDHLDHYEMMLACNLGMGIQSSMRGPRLYDTEETKQMVKGMVDWYKKYRGILESDVIHLRRADGRDIDFMMKVNPGLREKGFLMVFNPTDEAVTKTIKVPLYYTGLTDTAKIREKEGKSDTYRLDRNYEIEIEVSVEPNWYNWYVIE